MTDSGFSVEAELPFACQPGWPSETQSHGSLLLLRVVNLLDVRDADAPAGQERLEARLDLMLHWLGLQLFGETLPTGAHRLTLGADWIGWEAETPPPPGEVTLLIHVHPALPAPLRLPARMLDPKPGRVEARLQFSDEALADAWGQWLFRRHRRAVHEARGRTGAE